MSANLTVKEVPEKATKLIVDWKHLVDRYEALYFKVYLRSSLFRIAFFITILILVSLAFYSVKNPNFWEVFERIGLILSTLLTVVSLFTGVGFGFNQGILQAKAIKEINELENVIVADKLNESFGFDDKLKKRVTDIYIELTSLTKAKYETAFRFYSYEYYFYTVLSLIITVFFTFRIL